ncbi:hypothetical protein GH714_023042 [Hevea brasiliensis]|uniref:Nudix hydrolase domain-containing protein n=1 Tax=Hevea brasiliensis TaxID=3981 RepID=A0A6A6KJ37_HEVBR|nr:hypothetical protein GH714_023042 [Hevea brasiliensis]
MIAEPHLPESPKTEFAIPTMVESVSILGNSAPTENGINHVKLLPASNDDHGGVIVDMIEPVEPDIFLTMLRASISLWRQQEKRGVWIKLPIELANLVETAVKEGFCYHHAEPSYLMLVYWIPETSSTIPANASHREKLGAFRGTGVWKIPTGVVDEGEDIFMAATREVKEETGIDTEFQEILAFRETHKSFFGKSDLFFLCFLHPLSFDIQKQELEIEAAQNFVIISIGFHQRILDITELCYPYLWGREVVCHVAQISKREGKKEDANRIGDPLIISLNGGVVISGLQLVFCIEHAESRKLSTDVDPSSNGCTNCTICQYPCHPLGPPPPSLPNNPPYGVPPPPYPISGCPPYGTPPSQVNCTLSKPVLLSSPTISSWISAL